MAVVFVYTIFLHFPIRCTSIHLHVICRCLFVSKFPVQKWIGGLPVVEVMSVALGLSAAVEACVVVRCVLVGLQLPLPTSPGA